MSLSFNPVQTVQLFTESNLAYKFLKNPESRMSIWLRFWHENSVVDIFWCNIYGVQFEKSSETSSESLLKEGRGVFYLCSVLNRW